MIIEKFKLSFILFLVFVLIINAGLVSADDSNMSVFIVPLPPPSDLSATVISYEQINLSWSVVVEAESYKVYKSGVLIASVDTNSYSVTGLESNTSYSFTVSSVSGSGESSQSSSVSATTLSTVPEVPIGGGYNPGSIFDNLIIPARKKGLTAPLGGFKILINNGVIKTADSAVTVQLDGGPDAVQVEISNDSDFKGSITERYVEKKSWVLSINDGQKTVYVRFLNNYGDLSPMVSDSIILDTNSPEINITKIKNFYGVDEDIIIEGTINEPAEVIFYWDRKYGLMKTGGNDKWAVNLGKMSLGSHSIILMAKDDVNNYKTIAADILIKAQGVSIVKPTKPFSFIPFVFENIGEKIKSIARFISPEQEVPIKIVIVSQDTPRFLDGEWNLLPVEPLK